VKRAKGLETLTSSLGNDHFDRSKVLEHQHLMIESPPLQAQYSGSAYSRQLASARE
jgi:hypothetical protein